MITHIRMKNFKSWADSGEVELAPLTGFFGTNSSGKSSLLQMLLLLKQTAEQEDAKEVIFFGNNGSYVNLGNFHEVIHGHKRELDLELQFGCKLQKSLTFPFPGHNEEAKIKTYSFTFSTSIQEEDSNLIAPNINYTVKDPINLKIGWAGDRIYYEGLKKPVPNQIHTSSREKNCYGGSWPKGNTIVTLFSNAFEDLFSQVYYLGPTRVDPRRRYSWNGEHPEHIKQWGSQTIGALLSARVRKLKTSHDEGEVPIDDKISDWLQKMDLAHSFSLDWASQGAKEYEVRIQKTPTSPPVTLVDMGYGLTQFLPVLVLCYYSPEGSTLILEQPGIHLHPMVQSQIADLLIEVVNERKLQILVESHSEHLLNRLQRRIAEEKISVEKTALYFCRNDEGVSSKERLITDEFGNISNWPENFFGNEMGELFARAEAEMERRKKVEG